MNKKHKKVLKIIAIIILPILIGIMVEGLVSAVEYYKTGAAKGILQVKPDKEETTAEYADGMYYVKNGGKNIVIDVGGKYVNKFQYGYLAEKFSKSQIVLEIETAYGKKKEITIEDSFMIGMERSVVNIGKKVYKIEIQFPEESYDVKLNNFVIKNSYFFNPFRMLFFGCIAFIVVFLCIAAKYFKDKPEVITAVFIMVLGSLILILNPARPTSFDEQIHFMDVYKMGVTKQEEAVPLAVQYLDNYAPNLNYMNIGSAEEHVDQIRVLNVLAKIPSAEKDHYQISVTSAGYVLQALFLWIGSILKLPFCFLWLSGKFANLLLYTAGMYFSIKCIPYGKYILSLIALLPTMLYLSVSYTYDVTVTVFVVLSSCILLKALSEKDAVMSAKTQAVFLGMMFWGCLSKAVYAPLVLNGFLLKEENFKKKKSLTVFRIAVVVVFLILMSTFVLPAITGANVAGDARGGDTSVGMQLANIFRNPFIYAGILLRQVLGSFGDITIGEAGIGSFAYIGPGQQSALLTALVVFVIVSDSYVGKKEFSLKWKEKLIIFINCLLTIGLSWTALYLSFTEVGESVISGFQGRYYFPFLLLLFLLVKSDKIKCLIDKGRYAVFVFASSSAIILYQVYSLLLTNGCM